MKLALLLSIAFIALFSHVRAQEDTLEGPLHIVRDDSKKYGLANMYNKMVIPAIYDQIKNEYRAHYSDTPKEFHAYYKDSVIVYNRYGKRMCGLKAERIVGDKLVDGQGDKHQVYWLRRGRGLSYRTGIALEDGTVTVPIKYRQADNERYYDYYLQKFRTGNNYALINALTGVKSDEASWTIVLSNGGILYDKKGSQIVDSNMNLVHTDAKYGLSKHMLPTHPTALDYMNIDDYEFYYGSAIRQYYTGWNRLQKGALYVRNQYGKTEGKNGYVRLTSDPKFGLVDIENKRELPVEYDLILSFRSGDQDTLVCIRNDQNAALEIYDYALNPIRKLTIDPNWVNVFTKYNFSGLWYSTKRLALKDDKGKIGLISLSGQVKIPFEFDDYFPFYASYYRKGFSGFAMHKNGKYGLYDIEGNQLLAHEYDTLTSYDQYYLGHKGKEVTVFNTSWEQLADEVTFFQYDMAMNYMGQLYRDKRVAYCIKAGQLYVIEEGRLTRIDDDYLLFDADEKVVLHKYRIDRNGTILNKDDENFPLSSPKDYISEPRDAGVKISPYGTQKIKDSELRSMFSEKSYTKYRYKDRTQCIKGIETNEWLIEPGKYGSIFPVLNEPDGSIEGYWVQFFNDSLRRGSDWYLLSKDEQLVMDAPFDFPNPAQERYTIVRRKNKFGILNAAFELILPCEYDHVYKRDDHVLIYNKGLWYFYDDQNGLSKNGFKAIGTQFYNKGNFVFDGNLVGFASKQGEMLIPFSEESTLIANYDLYDFLEVEHPIFRNTCEDAQRQYNNLTLLKNVRGSNSDHSFMETYFLERRRRRRGIDIPVPAIWLRTTRTRYLCSSRFQFHGYFSFVEIEETGNWTAGYRVDKNYNLSGLEEKKFGTAVYSCEGDSLTQLSLTDFLLPGAEAKLDQLLLDKMAPFVKSYYATPEDVDRMLSEMKQTFVLVNNDAYCFYINDSKLKANNTPVEEIYLRFKDLQGICKPIYISE